MPKRAKFHREHRLLSPQTTPGITANAAEVLPRPTPGITADDAGYH